MKKYRLPFVIALPSIWYSVSIVVGIYLNIERYGFRAFLQESGGAINLILGIFLTLFVPVIIYIYSWFILTKVSNTYLRILGVIIAGLLFIGCITLDIFSSGLINEFPPNVL